MHRKAATAIVLTLGLLLSTASLALAGSPTVDDRVITRRLDVDRIVSHIERLSVDIGPRVASSPEEEAAAAYIAETFAGYGYDVEIQEFPYANTVGYATMQTPRQERLLVRAGGGSPLTPAGGVTAPVVDAGFGAPGDFPADTAGKIALIQRGQETFANMIANADAAGAVGVLIANTDWNIFSATVSGSPIPFVTMNDEAGDLLRAAGDVTLTLEINRYTTSQNVIATRSPRSTFRAADTITTFVAHYDSVPAGPGANDNASGTATLLELSRVYRSLPVNTELRFIAVGAEEVGLRGSRYYVEQLSDDEISRTVATFNMDMTGTAGEAQTTLYVNTLDGDNLVAQESRAAAQRHGYGDIINAPFQRGASDHVPFYEVGIPAANHIWREPGTHALEPWYHTPHDTIEHISQERLQIAAEIIAAASYRVARPDRSGLDTATPRGALAP